MNKSDRIYVAGHSGLVGSALVRALRAQGYENILRRTHDELDLTNQSKVGDFFRAEKPDCIFLAAARVGGILANSTYPADFIRDNLQIQTNIIQSAYENRVNQLLFLGSSCIYPRDCPQPIREDYLLTGPLEKTNSAYAIAKIAGIEMCHGYNRQYGTRYLCAMPANLYGTHDQFDLQNSHVLPAMIRKFHEAKQNGSAVELWGSGTPRREFLHVNDLAGACIHLLNLPANKIDSIFSADFPPLINIGSGSDVTIRELADLISAIVGYTGEIQWDRSKPDGTPRKILDSSRINSLGWSAKILLPDGIRAVYAWYQSEEHLNRNDSSKQSERPRSVDVRGT